MSWYDDDYDEDEDEIMPSDEASDMADAEELGGEATEEELEDMYDPTDAEDFG